MPFKSLAPMVRDGVWPSGKATVFGIVTRRFESYHPSQPIFLVTSRFTGMPSVRPALCVNHPQEEALLLLSLR